MSAFLARRIAWPLVFAMLVVLQTASEGAQQTAQQTATRGRDSRTWYQAYTDGVRAIQAGNWQAAVDSLEASKRARGAPKPGRRVPFYGDIYDDYLPDYYLGTAYLNLKRFADADRAFQSVRDSGVIGPRDREYAQLDARAKNAKAGAQLAQAPPPPAAGGSVASSAPSTAPSSSAVKETANAVPAPVTTQGSNQTANAPPPPLSSSPAQQTAATATPATIPQPGLAPLPPSGPARSGTPAAPRNIAADANSVRPPPSNSGARVTKSISPADEQAAIAAYLSGQYEQSAKRLANAAGSYASPRVSFYLACSRAALLIVGQGDAESLAEARAALTKAGGPAQFSADRRYISPRVLQMVEGKP